jgi:hypothetical protein
VIDIVKYLNIYIDGLNHYLPLTAGDITVLMHQWIAILRNCREMFRPLAIDLNEYIRVEAAR